MKRSREPEENIEPHLQSGDTERFVAQDRPAAKITYLDSAVEDGDDDADSKSGHAVAMKCSLPPHQDPPLLFKSYADYEIHYSQTHTNRCLECRKNFPTDHLLGIHIEECHDSLIRVRRDKGEHTVSLRKGPCPLANHILTCHHSTHASWKGVSENARPTKSAACT